jgi:pimeloyl-ACP methyl ester carboxylesterase
MSLTVSTMKIISLILLVAVSQPTNCCGLSSPNLGNTASTTKLQPSTPTKNGSLFEFDYQNNDELPWMEDGYNVWKWKGEHDINYIELGDKTKPALILIHGFGASSFHFRNNIPILARDFHVFAFCKLGFGLSDKPITDYSAETWRDQTVDFLKEVVQKPAVLAGNSLGGFTSLYTAATDEVQPLVRGVVLMNSAGRFRDGNNPKGDEKNGDEIEVEQKNEFVTMLQTMLQRAIISVSFVVSKQPKRIEQVLRQVYPINTDRVDSKLVESIRFPSLDPNASEVFYRVITKNGNGPVNVYNDDLLEKIGDCPLLLLWGEYDPWIRPAAADKIQALKPSCSRISINAGHCPHDENPEAVNDAIRNFMLALPPYPT